MSPISRTNLASSVQLLALLSALLTAIQVSPFAVAIETPNIVLIIADDLGYGETGMMGNREIPTPHIDALAANGVRCTSGYVTSSYCSPSRAGIMTGRYQSRFGYDQNPTGKRNLADSAGLPESEATFVTKLSEAGYATGLVGKWHLGTSSTKRPTSRGFESFFGFLHEGHYYVPGPPYEKVWTMVRDKSLKKGQRVREGNFFRGNYAPIDEPDYDADNPLLRETKELTEFDYLTDVISEEAVDFIDDNASDPFCLVVSYNAVHSPMQAKDQDVQAMRRIKDVQRRIFAGMLVAMDRGIGQVTDAIEKHGLTRRTLVVFLSDNGGPTEELTSSNAPLRGGKGSLYEGGVCVPMIWSLPGQLPAGVTEDRPVLSLDVAATALELAGVSVPENYDGKSLMSWLPTPNAASPHQTIFWRMQRGKLALREGNWKIVRPAKDAAIELYHLSGENPESRNLASEHPEKLGELIARWKAMNTQMMEPIQ